MSNEILNAGDTHLDTVTSILGEAFISDPLFNWFSTNESYPYFAFQNVLPSFSLHGHVYKSEDDDGAAIWLPPGIEFPISAGIPIIWRHLRHFGAGTAMRFVKALGVIDKYHYKPPHYYLFAIGVIEAAQGKGVGSALMKTVTVHCDEEQMPAYLENSKEKNLDFYQKHGFEIIEEVKLPDGPSIWPMLRRPR